MLVPKQHFPERTKAQLLDQIMLNEQTIRRLRRELVTLIVANEELRIKVEHLSRRRK